MRTKTVLLCIHAINECISGLIESHTGKGDTCYGMVTIWLLMFTLPDSCVDTCVYI